MNKAMQLLYKVAKKEETKEEKKKPTSGALALAGGGAVGGMVSGARSKFFEDGLNKDITNFEKKHRIKFSPADKSRLIRNKHVKSIATGAGTSLLATIMNNRLNRKKEEAKKR